MLHRMMIRLRYARNGPYSESYEYGGIEHDPVPPKVCVASLLESRDWAENVIDDSVMVNRHSQAAEKVYQTRRAKEREMATDYIKRVNAPNIL